MRANVFLGIVLTVVFFMGAVIGWVNGWLAGVDYERELTKKVECQVNYSGTPYKEIPGRCLKYFSK